MPVAVVMSLGLVALPAAGVELGKDRRKELTKVAAKAGVGPAARASERASAPELDESKAVDDLIDESVREDRASRAIALYRHICLAALSAHVPFSAKALERGLVPVVHDGSTPGSTAAKGKPAVRTPADADAVAAPVAAGESVYALGSVVPVEVTVRGDQRCTVWLRARNSPGLRDGFKRAVEGVGRRGNKPLWVVDRVVEQADGARRQMRAELTEAERRLRFDAVLTAAGEGAGLQALALVVDPPTSTPLEPTGPGPAASNAAAGPLTTAAPVTTAVLAPPPSKAPVPAARSPAATSVAGVMVVGTRVEPPLPAAAVNPMVLTSPQSVAPTHPALVAPVLPRPRP